MSTLHLTLDRRGFAPGEVVSGTLEYLLDAEPRHLTVYLLWYTAGRAKEHVSIVAREKFESPGRSGAVRFELPAPPAPPSFYGKLVSVSWAVEAVSDSNDSASVELTIAPEGRPINLYDPPDAGV